jgi:hypothetical protein
VSLSLLSKRSLALLLQLATIAGTKSKRNMLSYLLEAMNMTEKELVNLKKNMNDYKSFSFIFLFLSAFLYIGSLLPYDGKTTYNTSLVMLASFGILLISVFFYWMMRRGQNIYNKNI